MPPKKNELLSWLSSNTITSIGNYSLGKTIGEGTFGKVKIGRHIITGLPVAIKILDKIHAPAVVREIEIWRHLKHPNIVQLYEVICSETRIFMITEYCSGGEVLEFICKNGKFDDKSNQTKMIFWQIVDGIKHCHDMNYVHRDLKLENILLDDKFQIKIIDFGFTREINSNKLLDTFCGSVAYAAPEIISAKKYSGKLADIWSLGIILFTIVCGYLPFDEENENDVQMKIKDLDFQMPEFLEQETIDLLNALLVLDPTKRPNASDILLHSWFDTIRDSVKTFSNHKNVDFSSDNSKIMIHHFKSLGFDTSSILKSVKADASDSLSSLWHLSALKTKDYEKTLLDNINNDALTDQISKLSTSPYVSNEREFSEYSVHKGPNKEHEIFVRSNERTKKSLHRNVDNEEIALSRPGSAGSRIVNRSSMKNKRIVEQEEEDGFDMT